MKLKAIIKYLPQEYDWGWVITLADGSKWRFYNKRLSIDEMIDRAVLMQKEFELNKKRNGGDSE